MGFKFNPFTGTLDATSSEFDTLASVTGRGATTSTESTFTGGIVTNQIKSSSSAGVAIKANSGSAVAEFGLGGGGNWTFEDGVKLNAGTASRALVTDSSKNIAYSATTSDEIGYLSGVTSSVQTQLDAKLESVDLTNTYVGYGSAGNVLTGSSNLTWDNSTGTLNLIRPFNDGSNGIYLRDTRVGSPTSEADVDHFKVRVQQNYCELTLRTSQYDANATTAVNWYKGSGIGTLYHRYYSGTTFRGLIGIDNSNQFRIEGGSSTIFNFLVGNSAGMNVATGASAYITFQAGNIFGSGALTLYGSSHTTGNVAGLYAPNGDSLEFKQGGVTRMTFGSSGNITATNTQTLGTDFFNISSVYNVTGSLLRINFTGAAGRAMEVIDNSFNDGTFKVVKNTGAAPSNSQVAGMYIPCTFTHSDAGAGDGVGKGARIEVSNNTASSGLLMGLDVKATANSTTAIGARIRSSSSGGTAIVTRQEYSSSVYFDTKVSSAGVVSLDAVGASAKFDFLDDVSINTQTASTIASFDANKVLTSLSTSTYPSLTELSYVKGVTSSIQDQIDNITVSPAGSDTEIQFNNAGSFGADSNLTWDGSLLGVKRSVRIAEGAATIANNASYASLALVTGDEGSFSASGGGSFVAGNHVTTDQNSTLTATASGLSSFVNVSTNCVDTNYTVALTATASGKSAKVHGYFQQTYDGRASLALTASAAGSSSSGFLKTQSGGNTRTGTISSTASGAFAHGYVYPRNQNATLTSTGFGSVAIGKVVGQSVASTIKAQSPGSFACGSAYDGTIQATSSGSIAMGGTNGQGAIVEAVAQGAVSLGYAQNSGGRIRTAQVGCFAQGSAKGGKIYSTAVGSMAQGYSNFGRIIAAGKGSIARGYAKFAYGYVETTSAALGGFASGYAIANGYNYTRVRAENKGSFAVGYAYGSYTYPGRVEAVGIGSFAGGAAKGGYASAAYIQANGQGSMAFGNCPANYSIIANGVGSIQFGIGTNSLSNSLKVGQALRLKMDYGAPASPANGDIWVNSGYVYIRSNGSSVKIT